MANPRADEWSRDCHLKYLAKRVTVARTHGNPAVDANSEVWTNLVNALALHQATERSGSATTTTKPKASGLVRGGAGTLNDHLQTSLGLDVLLPTGFCSSIRMAAFTSVASSCLVRLRRSHLYWQDGCIFSQNWSGQPSQAFVSSPLQTLPPPVAWDGSLTDESSSSLRHVLVRPDLVDLNLFDFRHQARQQLRDGAFVYPLCPYLKAKLGGSAASQSAPTAAVHAGGSAGRSGYADDVVTNPHGRAAKISSKAG